MGKNRINYNNLALYGGLAAVAYAIFTRVRAAGNLIFIPGQVLAMGYQGGVTLLTFSVQVQNTSSTSLQINSFAGSVYSSGTLVGNVYNFLPIQIPGNSMVVMQVQVQLMALGLVDRIVQAFQTKNFSQDITVDGYVNTLSFQVPVNFTMKVGS